MKYLPILLLLAGCATFAPPDNAIVGKPYMTQRVQLDEQELQAICKARAARVTKPRRSYSLSSVMATSEQDSQSTFNGCFDWINGVCVVYTRKGDPLDTRYQGTVGHENLHCELGLYH